MLVKGRIGMTRKDCYNRIAELMADEEKAARISPLGRSEAREKFELLKGLLRRVETETDPFLRNFVEGHFDVTALRIFRIFEGKE